ncbi:MAG: nitroreductase family protein [Thermodesulfovibrionales bacterium]
MSIDSAFSLNDTLKTIRNRHSIRTFTGREVSDDQIKILLRAANEAPQFLGEPRGEFMAVVPVGYAAKPSSGPQKQPFEMKVRYLD